MSDSINTSLTMLASAARTVETTSDEFPNSLYRGCHIIIDATAEVDTATITPTIQGFDPVSEKWYTILVGSAINSVSTNVLRIYPGLAAAANIANDVLPGKFRVVMAVGDTDSMTYSVAATLIK